MKAPFRSSLSRTFPRLLGVVAADIFNDPGAQTKYGYFFRALEKRFPLVGVRDASLHGFSRLWIAVRAFHPDKSRWKERFYKNVRAFEARSRQLSRYLEWLPGKVDAILQVGVLFDATRTGLPTFVYTDYTAALSARKPEAGRSPFAPAERARWLAREAAVYRRAAHIFTRSSAVSRSILEDYGISQGQISVVGGGVNFPSLPEPGGGPQVYPPRVLFIGKDFHRKGGDILLRAFALARGQVPEARLQLVTRGPIPADLPQEGVEVISPTWNREAVAGLFEQAACFVLPSRLETWGDVLLEAMAYSLPCVGVAGDAMDELIIDGVTGFVVPEGDPESLSRALARLLAEPGLRQAMGQAGRARVESHFTWDHVVENMAPRFQALPFQIS